VTREELLDIAAWLAGLGLERYEQTFRDNAISADVLPKLSVEDLKELGISAVGDRRRLLDAIAVLSNSAATSGRGAELTASEGERRQVTSLLASRVEQIGATASQLDRIIQALFGDADLVFRRGHFCVSGDWHHEAKFCALFPQRRSDSHRPVLR